MNQGADGTKYVLKFLEHVNCDARYHGKADNIPLGQSVSTGPSDGEPDRFVILEHMICWPVGGVAFSYADMRSPGTGPCPS